MSASKEQYLVEMTVYDPSLPGVRTLYYSTLGYTSSPGGTPANQYYAPRVLQPGNYQVDMFRPGRTSGKSQVGFGELRLINGDGLLDPLLDYGFDGRNIVFKKITALGAIVLLASCSMEQPEFTNDEITVRVKDPQMAFDAPVQSTKYAGNNALPFGIEGSADIKGKPKPLTYGTVYNVTPVLVNTSKLIYQVHTSTVSIPAAYDKGVKLAKGSDYADQAAMEAEAPTPGTYRVCPSLGCFRLGASPVGQITADAVEGSTAADRSAAQVARRIALRVISSGEISAADVTALDAANSAEVGIYIAEEGTVMAALDQVLGSVGAWYGFDADRVLRMQQLTAPSGTPEITLTENEYLTLERLASNDAGRGIPVRQVNLNYAKNYTVQTSDIAGSAQTARDYSHWEQATLDNSAQWHALAYGNGVFVSVSYGSLQGGVVTSPDGIYWYFREVPGWCLRGWSIAYGNGMFVVTSVNSDQILTSPDGIHWTVRTLPQVNSSSATIAFGAGVFVIVANDTSTAYTSPDGITWTQRAMPVSADWLDVVYANGTFVTIANGGIGGTSTDGGATWTQRTLPVATPWGGVVAGNGIFIATLFDGDTIATSTDGVTWTQRPIPGKVGTASAYGSGLFMLIGQYACYLSTDGVSWSTRNYPAWTWPDSASYGNGSFVTADSVGTSRYMISPGNERVQWIGAAYRTVSTADASVQTAHLLAPELNVDTLLIDPVAAQSEAARLLALHKVRRDTLQVTVTAQTLEYIDPGKVVRIVSPRYGYSSGKLFRVTGVSVDWALGRVTLTLWG